MTLLLGVVSDVHCRDDALRAAFDEFDRRGVNDIIAGGDLVLEYRFSNEVVSLVQDRRVRSVMGNHEVTLLGPHGERARSAPEIDQQRVEFLRSLPTHVNTVVGGKRLLLTHGSPWAPHLEYLYPSSAKLDNVESLGVDIVVMGHTHVPLVRHVGRTLIVNPGSLAYPRGRGGGQTYAVIDVTEGDAEILTLVDRDS